MKPLRSIVPLEESKEARRLIGVAVGAAAMIGGIGVAGDHILTQKRRAENVAYMKPKVGKPNYAEVSHLSKSLTPFRTRVKSNIKPRLSSNFEDRRREWDNFKGSSGKMDAKIPRRSGGATGSW